MLGYFAGAGGSILFGVWFAGTLSGPGSAEVLFPFAERAPRPSVFLQPIAPPVTLGL